MDRELEEMVENFMADDSEASQAERRRSRLLSTPQGRRVLDRLVGYIVSSALSRQKARLLRGEELPTAFVYPQIVNKKA